LNLVVHKNINDFRDRCRGWLLRDEALNNSLIAVIDLIANKSRAYSGPYWFGTLEEDGDIVAIAVQCMPDGLTLSETNSEGVALIYDAMSESVGAPHRILGPEPATTELAERWDQETEYRALKEGDWNIHWVKKVLPPARPANGRLKKAEESDAEWVASWGAAYGKEKPAVVDVADFMLRKLRRNELYVWDDDGAKTMLTVSGFTDRGVRISAVFTPEEHRGRGYASVAVAVLSQSLLDDDNDFVVLHTKEGDPAERVYKRLGYEQIESRACYWIRNSEADSAG